MQDGNECWTHPTAGSTYAKYGRTTGCRYGGGRKWKMDVYEIVRKGEREKRDYAMLISSLKP